MKISDVKKEDGIALAILLNALKIASFKEISSKDIEALQAGKAWLVVVAKQVAEQLAPPPVSDSAAGGFKVKSMGQLPGPVSRKKKKS